MCVIAVVLILKESTMQPIYCNLWQVLRTVEVQINHALQR